MPTLISIKANYILEDGEPRAFPKVFYGDKELDPSMIKTQSFSMNSAVKTGDSILDSVVNPSPKK